MIFLIFIGRFFSLPVIFLKYAFKRAYLDGAGNAFRLNNSLRLRLILEDMGGVFVKFGQILAMRFDILPLGYAEALLNIADNARSEPNEEIFQIFRQETGKEINEVFDNLEKKPLAVASFDQIYKARLGKEEVVIKIQKPDIEKYIAADIALLRFISFFIDKIGVLKAVSMKEAVRQLEAWLKNDLDYRIEANNNRILWEHSQKHKLAEVIIPKIYKEFVSRKFLVQEFLAGSQAKRIIVYLERRPEEAKKILDERHINLLAAANRFISDLMRQYFIDKFFHADPHPDNLIVFPESKIGFIDFGLIGRPVYDNSGLLKFIRAGLDLDFLEAADGIVSFLGEIIKKDIGEILETDPKIKATYEQTLKFITKKMIEDLAPALKDWHFLAGNADRALFERSSANLFLKIAKAVEKYKLKFPPDAVAFLRGLVIVEMICLKLTPEFNLVKALKTFFERPADQIKEEIAGHRTEAAELSDFAALRFIDISPEKTGALSLAEEEKMYFAKEKFMNFVSALAEKYQELYNEIKEIR